MKPVATVKSSRGMTRSPAGRDRKRREFEREALVHLDSLYSYALRLAGGHEQRAEDLVQDAVLRAYRAWHQYENGTNCRAWLMTIQRNLFFSQQRKEGLLPTAELSDERAERAALAVPSQDPEQDFFSHIIDKRLLEAINALPLHYREAVVLSDVEGLTYDEVAEILRVPVGTVKSRVFRGRTALQRRLLEYAAGLGYGRRAAAA